MSASDNEFEQYLNELNDILVETFPTDCLDNLYLPRSIHEVMYSWVAIQPCLKYIPCLYRDNSITQPIYYIHLSPSDSILIPQQPCNCSLNILRLAIPLVNPFGLHVMSVLSYSGERFPLYPD